MIDDAQQRERIAGVARSIAPTLADAHLRPAGAGQCHTAWWVGSDHIFRLPRSAEESPSLAVEMAVLPSLAETLDIKIPVPEFLGVDASTGWLALGHRAVHGHPLDIETLGELSADQRDRFARQLAKFLEQLQAYPLQRIGVELPKVGVPDSYRRDLSRIELLVFPLMETADAAACLEMLRRAEAQPPSSAVVVHGDLCPEHLFFDAGRQNFVGVIDFGNLGQSHPSFDLAAVVEGLGVAFTTEVIRYFRPGSAEETLNDALFFCIWESLTWLADELEDGDTNELGPVVLQVSRLLRHNTRHRQNQPANPRS